MQIAKFNMQKLKQKLNPETAIFFLLNYTFSLQKDSCALLFALLFGLLFALLFVNENESKRNETKRRT